MSIYYGDNDPFAVAWLRELISSGLLAAGDVDDRDIREVRSNDLAGYEQVHFFAGIGGWPAALQLAGWEGPVWTGSCPCQPLSGAGKRKGHADERHLWPAFQRLVAECRPSTVFGEQVAGALGREWLAGVRADLEALGYAIGCADLPACCVGAPHIRQRLWWVADSADSRRQHEPHKRPAGIFKTDAATEKRGEQLGINGTGNGGVGDAGGTGLEERPSLGRNAEQERKAAERAGNDAGGMGHAPGGEQRGPRELETCRGWQGTAGRSGAWGDFDLIPCADGKARRVEPGVAPLVAGLPRGVVPSGDPSPQEAQETGEARVMRLRGYGNSINPWVAAEFVKAFVEARDLLA
ncbi:MAG TPA: DNA cytosine methyltransferase [Marinobacter sp.]|nr:DNA cytosine methyltransferase [Marinobacter sp.]